MNILVFSLVYIFLPAQPADTLSSEKILSLRGLKEFDAAELRLESLPKDAFLKEQKDPLALISFNSFRFPKRSEPLRYLFARGREIPGISKSSAADPEKINALIDIETDLSEIVLSDVQLVFGAPYYLPAAVLEIETIDEVSIKSDKKSGTPELLKTEVIFKMNMIFEKFIFFSRSSLKIENLLTILPPEFEWVKRVDLEAKLPIEKVPTEKDFEIEKESDLKFNFLGSRLPEVGSGSSSTPNLEEYLRTPQWQSYRGFDRWGYKQGAVTNLPNGGKLRIEIRQYDEFDRRFWRYR